MFNPVIQGERYDPDGSYVRRWVPELADVAGKAVHQPQEDRGAAAGSVSGGVATLFDSAQGPASSDGGYPGPMVDHREARERFLAARGAE
jgi:deoxyribodipyrimidine photo-lyase